jgi:hypothetical protein
MLVPIRKTFNISPNAFANYDHGNAAFDLVAPVMPGWTGVDCGCKREQVGIATARLSARSVRALLDALDSEGIPIEAALQENQPAPTDAPVPAPTPPPVPDPTNSPTPPPVPDPTDSPTPAPVL